MNLLNPFIDALIPNQPEINIKTFTLTMDNISIIVLVVACTGVSIKSECEGPSIAQKFAWRTSTINIAMILSNSKFESLVFLFLTLVIIFGWYSILSNYILWPLWIYAMNCTPKVSCLTFGVQFKSNQAPLVFVCYLIFMSETNKCMRLQIPNRCFFVAWFFKNPS